VLEADRGNEPVRRSNLHQSSYLRKLLQYQAAFKARAYQTEWAIPSLLVLNVGTSREHVQTILELLGEIGQPRSMLFRAIPTLGSFEKHPKPLLTLLDDVWQRVGHAPLTIQSTLTKEVSIGHTKVA